MSLALTSGAIDKLKTELERERGQPEDVFRLLADSSGGCRVAPGHADSGGHRAPSRGNAVARHGIGARR